MPCLCHHAIVLSKGNREALLNGTRKALELALSRLEPFLLGLVKGEEVVLGRLFLGLQRTEGRWEGVGRGGTGSACSLLGQGVGVAIGRYLNILFNAQSLPDTLCRSGLELFARRLRGRQFHREPRRLLLRRPCTLLCPLFRFSSFALLG